MKHLQMVKHGITNQRYNSATMITMPVKQQNDSSFYTTKQQQMHFSRTIFNLYLYISTSKWHIPKHTYSLVIKQISKYTFAIKAKKITIQK